MKSSILKKSLTGALTITLLMTPVIGANAYYGYAPTDVVTQIISESTSGSVTTLEEVPSTSSVSGTKSAVSGVYLATSVQGSIISTPMADIAAGYGLAAGEKPYVKFMNLNPTKSTLAYESLKMGAALKGGVIGPCINIELGKIAAGKYSLLSEQGSPIQIAVGIPKSFLEAGKKYAMVCVRSGGAITILEDMDSNSDTLTFNTTGGAGAYAIIKY